MSPHYERISAALKKIENLKDEERVDMTPSLLIGDELSKFEGMLKKIEYHRKIANTFYEEGEDDVADKQDGTISQLKEQESEEGV